MAFQAPAAVRTRHYSPGKKYLTELLAQNVASVTADLWPTMKSTLAAPWRTLRRPAYTDAAPSTEAQRPFTSAAPQRVEKTVRLPHTFSNLHWLTGSDIYKRIITRMPSICTFEVNKTYVLWANIRGASFIDESYTYVQQV